MTIIYVWPAGKYLQKLIEIESMYMFQHVTNYQETYIQRYSSTTNAKWNFTWNPPPPSHPVCAFRNSRFKHSNSKNYFFEQQPSSSSARCRALVWLSPSIKMLWIDINIISQNKQCWNHFNGSTFDRLGPSQDNGFVEILLLLRFLFKCLSMHDLDV